MVKCVSVFSVHKKARVCFRKTGFAFILFSVAFVSFFALLGAAAFFEGFFSSIVRYTSMRLTMGYFLAAACTVFVFLFIVSPLWRGVYAIILGYLLYARSDLSAVFCFFTTRKRYLYAVCAAFSSFLRIFLLGLSLFFVLRIGRLLASDLLLIGEGVRATLVLSASVLFSFLLLAFFWVLSAGAYLTDAAFLSAPLLSYRQARAVSKCASRGHLRTILKHQLFLLPYILFSILCFGIPFVFVLPYSFMTKGVLGVTLLRK